jgi:predicted ATPase with chaperone activity
VASEGRAEAIVVVTMRRHCALNPEAISLLRDAAAHGNLSARGLDRIARVARTIANLEGGGY